MAEQDIKAIIEELAKNAKELGLDAKGITEILTVVDKIKGLSRIEIKPEGGNQNQQNVNYGFQLAGTILVINGNKLNGKPPEEILNEFTQVIINALKEHFTNISPELKVEVDYKKINDFLEEELYPKIKNYVYIRSNAIIKKINEEQAKQHDRTRTHVTTKTREIRDLVKQLLTRIPDVIDLEPVIKRLDTILRNTGRLLREQRRTNEGIALILDELQRTQNSVHNLTQETRAEFARISSQLDRIEADVDTANRGIIEILDRLNNVATRHDINELNKTINDLFDILQKTQNIQGDMLERIQDALDNVFPSLDALYRQGQQNYTRLTQIAHRIHSIEQRLHGVATQQDVQVLDQRMRERFDRIDQQLQAILSTLGEGGGREESGGGDENLPAGTRFELAWVIARNQAAAQQLVQTNDLPNNQDYLILNRFLAPPGHLRVNLNDQSAVSMAPGGIQAVAGLMQQLGFRLGEVYLCLGARIVGTQRPWRWDI